MHWVDSFEVAAYNLLKEEDDVEAIRLAEDNFIDLTRVKIKHIDLIQKTVQYPSLKTEGKLITITLKNQRIISYLKIVFEYRKNPDNFAFRRRHIVSSFTLQSRF